MERQFLRYQGLAFAPGTATFHEWVGAGRGSDQPLFAWSAGAPATMEVEMVVMLALVGVSVPMFSGPPPPLSTTFWSWFCGFMRSYSLCAQELSSSNIAYIKIKSSPGKGLKIRILLNMKNDLYLFQVQTLL